jgi:hypothetical protein
VQVGDAPHDLIAGDAHLGRFLQGGRGHEASCAPQEDPVGLGDLHPQPGRLLVEPRWLHREVLDRKAILRRLDVEDGHGFPPILRVMVHMGDFHALELRHAPDPLADEADLGGVLTPPGDRDGEDIRKHAPICGVRAPIAHREQGDLALRGSLRQGIGGRGAHGMKHGRPGGPLGFQALVALHGAGDVPDGFTLFPDQGHPVDAAIAFIEKRQIGDVTIGARYQQRPQGPLADAEHGEKLCARRCHRRHAHQPAEHGGHEPTPPLSLQAHPLVLHAGWLSSRSHASIA